MGKSFQVHSSISFRNDCLHNKLADSFLLGPSEDLLGLRVPGGYAVVGIHAHNRIQRHFQDLVNPFGV